MEDAASSFRKLEEKDEAFRNQKKKIDCDAEDDVIGVSETKVDVDR